MSTPPGRTARGTHELAELGNGVGDGRRAVPWPCLALPYLAFVLHALRCLIDSIARAPPSDKLPYNNNNKKKHQTERRSLCFAVSDIRPSVQNPAMCAEEKRGKAVSAKESRIEANGSVVLWEREFWIVNLRAGTVF
jgi:hypothetical protein